MEDILDDEDRELRKVKKENTNLYKLIILHEIFAIILIILLYTKW